MSVLTNVSRWGRRSLMAAAIAATGALTLGAAPNQANAQVYGYPYYARYYPYYPYPYYAYYRPYYRYWGYPGPYVRIGWGWGWRGGHWGWGRGGWHHR